MRIKPLNRLFWKMYARFKQRAFGRCADIMNKLGLGECMNEIHKGAKPPQGNSDFTNKIE